VSRPTGSTLTRCLPSSKLTVASEDCGGAAAATCGGQPQRLDTTVTKPVATLSHRLSIDVSPNRSALNLPRTSDLPFRRETTREPASTMGAYTNIADPLVELHHLQYRERCVKEKWEHAFDTLDRFPNRALVRHVAELAAERDSLSRAIAELSAERQ